uniref:protein zyg-11 homolog B-like n=1 Tax=Myxine glutinosa TaxID=7769 RepID=UPI00358F754E
MQCPLLPEEGTAYSLVDVCLDYLCTNLELYCWMGLDGSLTLVDPPIFPQELAERLLRKLALAGLLTDKTVNIFRNSRCLRLRRACVRRARLSAVAFRRALAGQRLVELDARGVNADLTVADMVGALSGAGPPELTMLSSPPLAAATVAAYNTSVKGSRSVSGRSISPHWGAIFPDMLDEGFVPHYKLRTAEETRPCIEFRPVLEANLKLAVSCMRVLKITCQLTAIFELAVPFVKHLPHKGYVKTFITKLCRKSHLNIFHKKLDDTPLLSTEQTAKLVSELLIVKKLLHIVEQRAAASHVDTTLKFTLSALWNLTDESPSTCLHFVQHRGLDLFMDVLQTFPNDPSVQQKVLGLLNNIAEVIELHPKLMRKQFIEHIGVLLCNSKVEVSYFAAGIIAHLTYRGEAVWLLDPALRANLLSQLESCILSWTSPDCEMVAYRSFSPFFPLIECSSAPAVQLWAVWAMHHVCSKNAARYCSMLLDEGGLSRLRRLAASPFVTRHVRNISAEVLQRLELHAASSTPRLLRLVKPPTDNRTK